MKNTFRLGCQALIAGSLLVSAASQAQTLATGDTRTVRQPLVPPICAIVTAQFTSAQRNSPPTTDDTANIQAALNQCANTGKVVALEASGSNNAFYSNSLTATGVGLLIKSGATLYANNSYTANSQLVTFTGTNASLMGTGTGASQGTIDGRADIIYANNSATKTPRLVQVSNFTNFIAYNVTLTMALKPHLYAQSGTGFTAWGVTIRTPVLPLNPLYGQPGQPQYDGSITVSGSTVTYTQVVKNNDGIDLDSLTNATVINSSIEAGDDGVAVKSNNSNTSNVTVTNNTLFGTHGLSVGSVTANQISNILFENNYVYGNDLNGTPSQFNNGITIKTYPETLTVTDVSFVNTCAYKAKHLIDFYTNYGTAPTGATANPTISNIVVNGFYSTTSQSGAFSAFVGQSLTPMKIYLANVQVDAIAQGSPGAPAMPDQYVIAYEYNSNDTPLTANPGVTAPSFTPTFSGSIPLCTFVAN